MATIIEMLSNMPATGYIMERWNTGKLVIGDFATGESTLFGSGFSKDEDAAIEAFMSRSGVVAKEFTDGLAHATPEAYRARQVRIYGEAAVAAAEAALEARNNAALSRV